MRRGGEERGRAEGGGEVEGEWGLICGAVEEEDLSSPLLPSSGPVQPPTSA